MAPPAIILAGGLSRRMGAGNKALRMLAGQPLLAHVIQRLRDQCGTLVLNANGEAEDFAEFGLPVIGDGFAGFPGPLAGILAGLDWAADQGHQEIVSVSVDTPFLPLDLVHRLTEARGRSGIAISASSDDTGRLRDHPTCALWPVSLRQDLRDALESGLHRPGQFAASYDPGRAVFDSRPFDPFTNLNTPADLEMAARLL